MGKKYSKKLLALLMSSVMALGMMTFIVSAEEEKKAEDSAWCLTEEYNSDGSSSVETVPSEKGYATDLYGKMAYAYSGDNNKVNIDSIDILGYQSGQWQQTTYWYRGYTAAMKTDGGWVATIQAGDSETLWGEDLYTKYYAKIINEGRYVQLNIQVRNAGTEAKQISVAGYADIMIAENDYAPIALTEDGNGLRMLSDNSYNSQFICYFKGVNGTTPVDTYWIGYYGDRASNAFVQTDKTSLSNIDSAIAYSWQDKTINPEETLTFSVIIGYGDINEPPVIAESYGTFNAQGQSLDTFMNGEAVSVKAKVVDPDNTSDELSVYYAVDDSEYVEYTGVIDEDGVFSIELSADNTVMPGQHTINFYAMDINGGISAVSSESFTVLAQYTVTFADGNGGVLKTEIVTEGEGATAPEAPAREGYDFTGWDKQFDAVNADMTVTAQYKIKTYTVTFVDADGEIIGEAQMVEYGQGAVAPEAPEVEGSEFVGWDKDFEAVTEDMIVTAQYKEIPVTEEPTTEAPATTAPTTQASSTAAPAPATGDASPVVYCLLLALAAVVCGGFAVKVKLTK